MFKSKRVKSLTLSIMFLLFAGVFLVSCGGKSKVSGKYTIEFSKEEVAGNLFHNGFMVAIGATQENTLVLNDDFTYEYTKHVSQVEDRTTPVNVIFRFTGKYTAKKDQVTLEVPEDVEFSAVWGTLSAYLTEFEGVLSKGDKLPESEGVNPLFYFGTEFYIFYETEPVSKTVTVNKDGSYTYNEIANPEDE